jgi:hypothetical protein
VSADVPVSSDAARAPLGRTLCLARPVTGRLVLGTLLGAGAILADIGLMGTAAWLISRAAQHPNEASLAVAIVAVQFFGLSRGLFRYGSGWSVTMPPCICSPNCGSGPTSDSNAWLRSGCRRSDGATCWPGSSRMSTRYRTW